MASIQIYQYFTVDIDGHTVQGGSLSKARNVTLGDGELIDRAFKIGTESAVKVFDKTEDGALGDFNFLWMETDLDVLVQFVTDAEGTDAYDVKTLKGSGTAGQMGPALVLGSDVTQLLDGTVDTFDGTADTVDEIWVYNEDATDTAKIRVVVGT